MEKNKIQLIKRLFKNNVATDLYIRDVYGKEHIIYPNEEKTILIVEENKNDSSGINTGS